VLYGKRKQKRERKGLHSQCTIHVGDAVSEHLGLG
jgi:hypothetical protein